ncbi:hypothetical protein ACL02R_15155 [Streptomyces sp. MS19]|uniref:hypothetical protein n=1 Tax=Streptomyces sp. MS19 TaxID=3385972 RepID=UPI0039A28980
MSPALGSPARSGRHFLAPEPAEHRRLSPSPDSGFVRTLQVQLRDAKGVDTLRGRVPRRIDAGGTDERINDTVAEWTTS